MSADKNKFKKITLINSNNLLDLLTIHEWVYSQEEITYLKKLKVYVEEKGLQSTFNSELDFIYYVLFWVNNQWKHNGFNEPPMDFQALDILKEVHEKNAQFRCVEYGKVLTEVLQAFGFITRVLALRSSYVSYGTLGQGHVAMEVWINDLEKWVFLDPQFGIYLTKENSNIPLNYFEVYIEKFSNRFKSLSVHRCDNAESTLLKAEDKYRYLDFLKNYFGHIAISNKTNNIVASLFLEGQNIPLTFQGNPLNNAIFTNRPELFYPAMNRVALFLTYKNNNINFQELMTQFKIQSAEDYSKQMYLFAAKPEFLITIKTTSKLNQSYQFRDGTGQWKNVKEDAFEWSAKNGFNRLEVRSINEFNRAGPITFLEIQYQ